MSNPSWTELVVTLLIGLATMFAMWRGLLNVSKRAKRGAERSPGKAIIWLIFAVTVLAAPGFIDWNAPPPIWTWPIWFASAWGFFLLALDACWFDGIFPWIRFPSEKPDE
jgi:hypothetical protein